MFKNARSRLFLVVMIVFAALVSIWAPLPARAAAETRYVTLATNQAYGFWCDGTVNAVSGSYGVMSEQATGFTNLTSVSQGCTSNRDAAIYNDVRNSVPTWHAFNGDRIVVQAPAGWCVYLKVHSSDINNAVAWDC